MSHIRSFEDLLTTYEATRNGFLEMALERNRKATPVISQAKILKTLVAKTNKPEDILGIDSITDALLTASGYSDKAKQYINPQEQSLAINKFIKEFLIPAKENYKDELVYRFLITKGDSIGGSLRNLAGELAIRNVSNVISSTLSLFNIPFHYQQFPKGDWVHFDTDLIDKKAKGFSWVRNGQSRTLVFNYKVPSVGKNIDICLLNCSFTQLKDVISRSPESFIALGEVKGGIDPAGADEHWKTARTAFTRIRQAFANLERFPHTFFIGAAIETSMAQEIWGQLETNTLSNAANLTNEDQLNSLITWLCSL